MTTLLWTFSKTRGTAATKVGLTSPRLSTSLSTRPSMADRKPMRICALSSTLPKLCDKRQPQVLQVVGQQDAERVDGLGFVEPAVVQELDPLLPACGARGIEQRRQVLRGDLRDACFVRLGVRGVPRAAALHELREGRRPRVAGRSAVDQHDLPHVLQLGAVPFELGELLLVLHERHDARRIVEDVGAFVGCVRRVDRRGGAAGAHDAEVDEHPLDARGRENRAPLLDLDAEGS